MERDLKNKILAVTGGANGIGYQITRHFLKAGVKVAIILDIDIEQGNKATEELNAEFGENRVEFIKCNVIEDLEETYRKICDKYGKFDVLVNCAGVFNENNPDKCIEVNLKALIKWCLKFVELFRKDKDGNGGTIINIASTASILITSDYPVYQASKFGVLGFTKSLGHEKNYKDHGVRVMGICPGFTETNMTAEILDYELPKQGPEVVGECAVKVFQTGETATMWLVEGGKMEEVK